MRRARHASTRDCQLQPQRSRHQGRHNRDAGLGATAGATVPGRTEVLDASCVLESRQLRVLSFALWPRDGSVHARPLRLAARELQRRDVDAGLVRLSNTTRAARRGGTHGACVCPGSARDLSPCPMRSSRGWRQDSKSAARTIQAACDSAHDSLEDSNGAGLATGATSRHAMTCCAESTQTPARQAQSTSHSKTSRAGAVARMSQRPVTQVPLASSQPQRPPPGSPAGAGGPSSGRLSVNITSWHGVASWTWNAGDDVCGICRNPFDGCPPDAKFPGDDSPVVWGQCTHAFHLPCINKWLSSQQAEQKCPICRRAWEFKQS